MTRYSVESIFKAIDKFSGPIGKMQTRAQKFNQSLKLGIGKIGDLQRGFTSGLKRAALAGAAALGVAGVAMNALIEKGDALHDRSERLGFPVEALQKWEFVARQSGMTTEQLDNNLEQFTKRLGAARAGIGPMAAGLKKLNPGLYKLIKNIKDPAQAMEVFLDALGKEPDAAKRAALANAAFGKSGQGMINIALQGHDAIKAMLEQAAKNGVLTQEQVTSLDALGDTISSVKDSFMGFLGSVIAPLVPQLTVLAEKTRDWMNANRGLVSEKLSSFLKSLIDNLPEIVTWMKRIGIAVVAFYTLTAAAQAVMAVMMLWPVIVGAAQIAVFALAGAFTPLGAAVLVVGAALAAIVHYWPEIKSGFLAVIAYAFKFSELLGKIADLVAGITDNTGSHKGLTQGDFGRANRKPPATVSPNESFATSLHREMSFGTGEILVRAAPGTSAHVTKPMSGPSRLALTPSGTP